MSQAPGKEAVAARLELWGGIECTVNRVEDAYVDQMTMSGHAWRVDDIARIADLGLRTLRYPVLWEHVAGEAPDRYDWRWADERLAALQRFAIEPIVGLVHHGSGPRYTSLVDPAFPEKLAAYAKKVAERYPWLKRFTPVNEPLTTARFSGLYGAWYPHGRDSLTFLRTLLNEIRGTALAMRAIRTVQPDAELILTEDLGRVDSTPRLAYQAEFENHRRWLSIDLLLGRVKRGHALYDWFLYCGITPDELKALEEVAVTPAVLGFNHYLTSNRYLDERLERYPVCSHGGNGRDAYSDVETIRVPDVTSPSRRELLREAWDRYKLPIAITESHLYCTREEQMRWLQEGWDDARGLRDQGVDMRAVTVWSLLGTFDWISLCTRPSGVYEPGVWDLRSPKPRPTALTKMISSLSKHGDYAHPLLAQPGWWRRPTRALYPPPASIHSVRLKSSEAGLDRPLLITGGRGTLGQAFARVCELRGIPYCLLTRQDLDAADERAARTLFERLRPWGLVNAAGYVRVDDAEEDAVKCRYDNTLAPGVLARVCADHRVRLVTFSSDLVFDGRLQRPYRESDPVAPLNVYGQSKAEAERLVLDRCPEALIVRTSAFFGPWDVHNFAWQTLQRLRDGQPAVAANDVVISPTYVPDLAHTTLDLLIDEERGIWHLSNAAPVTWEAFARRLAERAGLDVSLVQGRPGAELGWRAARPRQSALASERGDLLGTLDAAITDFLSHDLAAVPPQAGHRSPA